MRIARLLVGSLVVVGLAGGVWLWRATRADDEPAAVAPALPDAWLRDRTAATYRVDWHGRVSANPLGQGAQEATIAITGELAMRGLGSEAGARLVGLSFTQLDDVHYRLLGRELLAAAALANVEAVASIAADGSVAALRFAPNTNPVVGHLFASLVRELVVTVPPDGARGPTWTVVEDAPNGRARATYTTVAQPRADLLALARRRDAYVTLSALPHHADAPQQLAATGHIVLDARGAIVELEDHDRLTIDTGHGAGLDGEHDFVLERTGTRTLATTERAPLGLAAIAKVSPEQIEDKLLVQQAGGLTFPVLKRSIELFSQTGIGLRGGSDLVRAVAFAKLHPERCTELAAMFDDPTMTPVGMGMVTDLLASTGTPEAQAALRDALGSDHVAALSPERRADLITRFARLDRPDAASVALLESLATGDGADGDAARLAVGAATRRLAASGELARSTALDGELRAHLAAAPAGPSRLIAILALGAARQPGDREALETWSRDGDAAERAAAKDALARFAPTAKDTP